ncbi:hypothetical protein [Desulfosporosinus sp. BICA1-9]|uniref:hypothetical protein n=1 Tax=Desulfosporosinus sp. BICA1-9 TaxID=1531958 RepID=UPI00054BCFC9|nr:hypothetical protein [Desulfosporosinus sp. BICA1-9]KJS49960.1 MAG: membrane protein [Peptococcaceae bacterium BRH_c23]KJS83488.1 MAG: membrane protein [Desulfosporosinus sp. BICA1-9]
METFTAGLGLQEILMLGLGIAAVGFILKKLFKLAITIAIIIALVYYGLPILQTIMTM